MYDLPLPALLLQPYIESYWKVRTLPGAAGILHEQIYVDGQADILFNFGCAYDRCGMAIPYGNLDGQRDYPVLTDRGARVGAAAGGGYPSGVWAGEHPAIERGGGRPS
jgi:hypothetical protein